MRNSIGQFLFILDKIVIFSNPNSLLNICPKDIMRWILSMTTSQIRLLRIKKNGIKAFPFRPCSTCGDMKMTTAIPFDRSSLSLPLSRWTDFNFNSSRWKAVIRAGDRNRAAALSIFQVWSAPRERSGQIQMVMPFNSSYNVEDETLSTTCRSHT